MTEAVAAPFDVEPVDPHPQSPIGRNRLERGMVKRRLMIDMAKGELSLHALATKYGASVSAVHTFRERHGFEIREMVDQLADEMVGLWIVDKRDRLAELQAAIEHISGQLVDTAEPPRPERTSAELAALGEPDEPLVDADRLIALSMTLGRLLRMAAEEMGQIPNRAQVMVTGVMTTVRLEGVDLDQL